MLIATPYSHLFKDSELRRAILERSDAVEIRKPVQAGESDLPEIFHCEYSLVAQWNVAMIQEFKDLASTAPPLLLSLHVSSRYQNNRVDDGVFVGIGQPMAEEELFSNAIVNMESIRNIFTDDVRVLIENNNDLATDAYQLVTDAGFLRELAQSVSVGLLLDIAHFRISAYNKGIAEQEYLAQLPLDAVEQLHLSRHDFYNGRACDAHEALTAPDWDCLRALLDRLSTVEYLTLEYYKNGNVLLEQLEQLANIAKG